MDGLKGKLPGISPQNGASGPVGSHSSSAASSRPADAKTPISGDTENADFPDGVGYTGNVALIMEENPAAVPNFVPVVNHFRSMLGPSWEMVILTRRGWAVPASLALRQHLASGAIKVRFLPPDFDHFPTHASVSLFLAAPWLWTTFARVNRLLMFQPDSILCSKSTAQVDDFLQWDFVGAPVNPAFMDALRPGADQRPNTKGYNGGLCIRNPRMFLDISRSFNFSADLYSGPPEPELPNYLRFEDHWFMYRLQEMPELLAEAKLPPADVAGQFSVETLYYDHPLGYHQPHRWQADRYDEIVEWCPEVGIIHNMEEPDQRWNKGQ